MRTTRIVPLLILMTISTVIAAAPPASQPQCEWEGVERIVAVGDVHGDCSQFVSILRQAGVINETDDWIAGKAHLVQTGDVLDRGIQSRQALDLLMKLEGQAAKAGGAVHALIGNHEAMVLLGDLRYMSEDEQETYGGPDGVKKLFGPSGKYGKWIRAHNTVIRVNDVLFLHGGLMADVAAKHKALADINAAVRDELAKEDETGLAMSEEGPLWSRTLSIAARGPEYDDTEIMTTLKKFKASRMVVGHTVTIRGVLAGLNDRLIMIDVGMSACYGGTAACLVIEKGQYRVFEIGEKKPRDLFESVPASQPDTLKPAA